MYHFSTYLTLPIYVYTFHGSDYPDFLQSSLLSVFTCLFLLIFRRDTDCSNQHALGKLKIELKEKKIGPFVDRARSFTASDRRFSREKCPTG